MRIGGTGQVACMKEMKNVYKILAVNLEEYKQLVSSGVEGSDA
jgi:hypothetical protein